MFCVVLSDGQPQLQEETERLRANKSLLYSQVLETEGIARRVMGKHEGSQEGARRKV